MSDLTLTLVIACSLVTLLLLAVLMLLLVQLSKANKQTVALVTHLLKYQVAENQRLRNQFLAPDVATLAGLNQATLPPESLQTEPDPLEGLDLGEAVDFEDALHARGFHLADVGDDLSMQGWPAPIVRNNGDDPIAYDHS